MNNGQWKPGESGNLDGRPPGAKNRDELRSIFQTIIEKELVEEDVLALLKELEPKDRIQVLLKMSEFVLPRFKAVEVTTIPEPEEPDFDLGLLTPEERQLWYRLYDKSTGKEPEIVDPEFEELKKLVQKSVAEAESAAEYGDQRRRELRLGVGDALKY